MNQQSDYLNAYNRMMESEYRSSTGERKKRLEQDLGHAAQKFLELVWWPAFGYFVGLHPEYAVRDFKDGWRYLDFAFFTAGMKICIEIDGFGSHWKDINRSQFADHLMRQNHLVIDGWIVIRFAYDDIIERPRRCQQILQQLLGKWSNGATASPEVRPVQQAILRLAMRSVSPISPRTVADALSINRHTASNHMRELVSKGYLAPANPTAKRICLYTVNTVEVSRLKFI